jgi:hypothetical protein
LAAGFGIDWVDDFGDDFVAALRVTNVAVDGRAPRVVVAATRRDDFDAGFFNDVRALLSAPVLLADFLPLRAALAGRRAVFVDCVPMLTI